MGAMCPQLFFQSNNSGKGGHIWVLSFGDPLFGHTFSPLTLYTVSVIGFLHG